MSNPNTVKNMSFNVRAEFIRIAMLYTLPKKRAIKGETNKSLSGALRRILIEPAKEGVRIISCDGHVLCAQWDKSGHASEPFLLDCSAFGGWDRPVPRSISFRYDNGVLALADTDDRDYPYDPSAIKVMAKSLAYATQDVTYPLWQKLLPDEAALKKMKPYCAPILNLENLAAIGKMYPDDGDERAVELYGDPADPMVNLYATFPWRPTTFLRIANMKPGDFDGVAAIRSVIDGEDDEL